MMVIGANIKDRPVFPLQIAQKTYYKVVFRSGFVRPGGKIRSGKNEAFRRKNMKKWVLLVLLAASLTTMGGCKKGG